LTPLHPAPTYTELYFPVLLQAVIAMALAAGLLSVSYILGKKVRNKVKDTRTNPASSPPATPGTASA